MTTEELNILAHEIAASSARCDIESYSLWPEEHTTAFPRWYNISSETIEDWEREELVRAARYLEARGLLIRDSDNPALVCLVTVQ